MNIEALDLIAIQQDIDNGATWRDLVAKYKVSFHKISRLAQQGIIKTRNKSEAIRLANKTVVRTHTEETKRKISKARIKFLTENPDMVPYKLNHYSKGASYPEQYFKDLFEANSIDLNYHKQVSFYELDFYNDDLKLCVEVDGEQHYKDHRIVESDKKRTIFLETLGWTIKRIRWSSYQKLSYDDKKLFLDSLGLPVKSTP